MISHKHKFIFIHIPKCGGTSIEDLFNWKGVKHSTMELYKEENSHVDLNNYYKYTFVRNPWDRIVSWYHYHKNHKIRGRRVYGDGNFKSWCKGGLVTHWSGSGWKDKDPLDCQSWIPDKKEYNFIGKVENYQKDFDTICSKIGLPRKELPSSNKSDHKHYTEYYDDETKQIVTEKYGKDIEHFGYKFGE